MQAYWQAANYLDVGQIYLQENPLLREPLRAEHIKPRLLGHWGTSPGLSFIYVHLNRLIQDTRRRRDLPRRPGPRRPGAGRQRLPGRDLLRDLSGGVAGHGGPAPPLPPVLDAGRHPEPRQRPDPGSIHEGGELGYVLVHAFGAAFDNPDLIVVAVVGDGEAETGPLEGSWKGVRFLNPARDGAVLPDPPPERLQDLRPDRAGPGRATRTSTKLLDGHGYEVHFVEGDDPPAVHQAFAATLDACYANNPTPIQAEARARAA